MLAIYEHRKQTVTDLIPKVDNAVNNLPIVLSTQGLFDNWIPMANLNGVTGVLGTGEELIIGLFVEWRSPVYPDPRRFDGTSRG